MMIKRYRFLPNKNKRQAGTFDIRNSAFIFSMRKLLTTILTLSIIATFFHAPTTVRAATLSRPPNNLGLVGYWGFDEGKGTKAGDRSGKGHTAGINGSTWADGKFGKGLSFNGSSNYAAASTTPSLDMISTDITASAWIYIAGGAGTYRIIVSKNDGLNTPTYEFGLSNGNKLIWYQEYGGSAYKESNTTPSLNEWHHVAFVFNNSAKTGTFYLDGVADGNVTGLLNTQTTTAPLYIGVDGPTGGGETSFFNGKIDDLRLYSRALGASEIASLYRAGGIVGKQSSKQGLVGYWPLNEGRGSKAGDFSGNGSNCTFYGSPSWTSGPRGSAINFPASTDYMLCGNNSVLNTGSSNFTLSAWVSRASSTSTSIIMGKRVYPPGYLLYFAGTSLGVQVNDASPIGYTLGSFAEINTWRLITVVVQRTTNQVFYYLDGALQSTTALSAATGSTDNAGNFGISADGADTVNPLRGKIDDVRIYNRALSAAEVRALYGEGETQINSAQNNFLTTGLVGLWSFNGKDLDAIYAYDRSGNSRNATLTGSPKPGIGKVSQAMVFSGSGQYARGSGFSESGTANQPYTFAAWIKPAAGEADGNIIHMSSLDTGVGWCLPPVAIVSGKARGYSWNGGGVSVTGTTTISPNKWYFVSNTWDASGGLKIYVNGVLENTTSQAVYSASGASNYLWLAHTPGGCAGDAGDFDGSLDEVRVYNRALSSSEVLQLYNMGK